jgi:ssDNA-binding Zn-finger/Zn-ribbon topoisomerase 1
VEGIFLIAVVAAVTAYFASRSRSGSASYNKPFARPALQDSKNQSQDDQRISNVQPGLPGVMSNTTLLKPPSGEFERSTSGFQPNDRCEKCGGSWIKHVNKENNGRFFGCSNYPRCKNTRDKQYAEKYCNNGHRRTPENTYVSREGRRRCLVCHPRSESKSLEMSRNRGRLSSGELRRGRYESERCRNGHLRSIENTYVRPDGERECRVCRRDARR